MTAQIFMQMNTFTTSKMLKAIKGLHDICVDIYTTVPEQNSLCVCVHNTKINIQINS